MRKVRSIDTGPEVRVRRALHSAGFRFRLHRRDLPGRPDLVFPRYRIAVFVHGCFWHWHGCKRSRMPATNREYWESKIARNVERDHQTRIQLDALEWDVQIIWECELQQGVDAIMKQLNERRWQEASRVA
jgi:DNA mismatch endonuclease (patch repair protein)